MALGAVGQVQRRMKKSAIGASSVTLVPTTAADPATDVDYPISQVVISTSGVTPPIELYGVAVGDGREFLITIEPVG